MAARMAAKTPTTSGETAMQSVAAAMRDAATTASDHATQVKEAASEVGSDTLQSLSRMTYDAAYYMAYGVVYATGFIAQSLPQENPIMNEFRDGGQAAMDELGRG